MKFPKSFHPDFVQVEGSINDSETQETLLDMARAAKVQIKALVEGKMYYVRPGDTIEMILGQVDRRSYEERRKNYDQRKFADRRQEPP